MKYSNTPLIHGYFIGLFSHSGSFRDSIGTKVSNKKSKQKNYKINLAMRHFEIKKSEKKQWIVLFQSISFTPWKIHMEPRNHPFQRKGIFQTSMELCSMLIFRGVTINVLIMATKRNNTFTVHSLNGDQSLGRRYVRANENDDQPARLGISPPQMGIPPKCPEKIQAKRKL